MLELNMCGKRRRVYEVEVKGDCEVVGGEACRR